VLIEQQFEHALPERRQAFACLAAALLGVRDVRGVIVGMSH
jgi:hypothetical protein